MKQLSDLKRYSRLAIANNRECFGHFYIKASDVEAIWPKWVSVDERLPEREEWYAVTWHTTEGDFMNYDFLNGFPEYVTHWLDNMPTAPEAG